MIRTDLDGKTDNHCFDWETGDAAATDAVFAKADVVVKQEIVYPRVHPAPMETCGAVADLDPVTGKLTLWSTTQAPHAHRTLYALVAGLPEHKIRVISPDIGGGFGNKVPIYPGYVCAIVGSLLLGKPVKWMEDRSENLTSTGFARDYIMVGEIAATNDGKILAIRSNVLADHGAFNGHGRAGEVSGRVLRGVHRQLRHRGRVLPHDRGVHQQGARRGGVRVLVPHHRGGVLRGAAGGLSGPRNEDGSRRAAAAKPVEAGAVSVQVQDRLGVRLGRLRDHHAPGDGHDRLRRSAR